MNRWWIDLRRLDDLRLLLGLFFPAAAGLALFGWRGPGVWAAIAAGALVTRFLLARLRTWTATPGRLSLLVRSAVLALFCPATLFDPDRAAFAPEAAWPALLALGVMLALVDWFVRVTGTRRLHPVVLTAAVLTLAMPQLVESRRVLPPDALVTGDLLDARVGERVSGTAIPWIAVARSGPRVLEATPTAKPIQDYLRQVPPPDRPTQTVARLVSDDLPPLEDLIVGGRPSPLGQGSVIALVIGGLFLVYRGVAPLRVPALALCACYATLVVLPLPTQVGHGGTRRWLFERDVRVGWSAGLTFVHYLMVASPVVLTSLFLAPLPGVRPGRRWAAAGFAIVYGTLAAVATALVSVTGGALLALLTTQLVLKSPAAPPRIPA